MTVTVAAPSRTTDRLPTAPLVAALRERQMLRHVGTNVRRAERVSALVADRVCVELLGMHPSEVYGDAWWDTAGFDPWRDGDFDPLTGLAWVES